MEDMKTMIIKLLKQHGKHAKGTTHQVIQVVSHGGHIDSEKQYMIYGLCGADIYYVPSDDVEELET